MTFIIGLFIGALLGWAGVTLWMKNHDHDPDAEVGWWTVFGVWKESLERYSLHVQADNARAAEDLTQWEAKETGNELWVVAVCEGKIDNADGYATFVDPDMKRADWLNPKRSI